jgi:hypothetical protein
MEAVSSLESGTAVRAGQMAGPPAPPEQGMGIGLGFGAISHTLPHRTGQAGATGEQRE